MYFIPDGGSSREVESFLQVHQHADKDSTHLGMSGPHPKTPDGIAKHCNCVPSGSLRCSTELRGLDLLRDNLDE
eukprot:4077229-Pyramimonas_sp.AAC.1